MSVQIPSEPRRGEPLEAAWGVQVVRALRSLLLRGGPGVLVTTTPSGTTISAIGRRGSGAAATEPDCPFDITIAPDETSALFATFRAGTINQLLPDNYLDGVEVPASGTKYLVLSCTVTSGAITGATFFADDDPPVALAPMAGEPPTAFDLLIGVSVNGLAIKVWGCGNIQAVPVEAFRLQKAVPVAGQVPYDVYYTWQFSLL